MPFENMQAIADELRCSVIEAATADPEWRHMARTKLHASMQAKQRRESSSGH